jgi:hypothetical protein
LFLVKRGFELVAKLFNIVINYIYGNTKFYQMAIDEIVADIEGNK